MTDGLPRHENGDHCQLLTSRPVRLAVPFGATRVCMRLQVGIMVGFHDFDIGSRRSACE